MKIVRLEAENIKRLKAVSIEPTGAVITVGGKNGAGKSSVLDSVAYALGGKNLIPGKPIREGEDKGHTQVDLGDIVVTRKWTTKGISTLTIKNKDGAVYPSPQKMLDKMIGDLSFDPLEFSRMHPKKQAETLRGFSDFDFEKQDELIKTSFDERSLLNKEVESLKAQLEGLTFHEDAPAEEVDPTEVYKKIEEGREHNQKKGQLHSAVQEWKNGVDVLTETIKEQLDRIQELQQAVEANQKKLQATETGLKDATKEYEEFKEIDVSPLETKMAQAQEINRKIADNKRHGELAERLQAKAKEADDLTVKVQALRDERTKAVSDAKLPVEGLTFGTDGVAINGIPFEQCSSAEQLKTSVAVGLAMNPKLKIMQVREGSLLDEESLQAISKMVEDADAQIWVEKISETGEGVTVHIEDGMVVEKE